MSERAQAVEPRRLLLGLLLIVVALSVLGTVPSSARAAICLPREPPWCPNTSDLNALLDSVEEPAANAGDSSDHATPDEEACWEALSGPAFDTLDGAQT